MQNLAGDLCADLAIRDELRCARIPEVMGPRSKGEVSTCLTGKLGDFTFTRAWTYWVVAGPLPHDLALKLYGDPAGARDIRVGGFAGGLSPEQWGGYVQWVMPDGTHVLSTDLEVANLKFEADHPNLPAEVRLAYSDDPASIGASAFVKSYHIDTELGLRLFADTLRTHDLV